MKDPSTQQGKVAARARAPTVDIIFTLRTWQSLVLNVPYPRRQRPKRCLDSGLAPDLQWHNDYNLATAVKIQTLQFACIAIALFTQPGYSQGTNLIQNGGFEQPAISGWWLGVATPASFTGWTVDFGDVDLVNTAFYASAAGTQSLDLNGSDSGGVVQTVPTIAGQTYRLIFSFAGNPNQVPRYKQMEVRWNDTVLAVLQHDSAMDTSTSVQWRTFGYTVVGNGNDKLSFRSLTTGTPAGPAIDEVSLIQFGGIQTNVSNDVVSSFDQSTDGWNIVELSDTFGAGPYTNIDRGPWPPNYLNQGNLGGCLRFVDRPGDSFYMSAPSKFLGDVLASYGLALSFELKAGVAPPGNWYNEADLILTGSNGLVLATSLGIVPTTTWISYQQPMTESAWRVGSLSGRHPSQAEFFGVLSGLKSLWIRGEYFYGDDVILFDNARLDMNPVLATSLSIRLGDKVEVVQNLVVGYQYALDASPDLITWTEVQPTFTATSATITNKFDLSTTNQFFRIRKVL